MAPQRRAYVYEDFCTTWHSLLSEVFGRLVDLDGSNLETHLTSTLFEHPNYHAGDNGNGPDIIIQSSSSIFHPEKNSETVGASVLSQDANTGCLYEQQLEILTS